MTIHEAFLEFIQTPAYKNVSKKQDTNGHRYRQIKSRFAKGKANTDTLVKLLTENGYEVNVIKPQITHNPILERQQTINPNNS